MNLSTFSLSPSWLEISTDALLNNARTLLKNSDNASLLAVVKADGYGHGGVNVAHALKSIAHYFGVATLNEAIELREAGIRNPILVFGPPTPLNASLYKRYEITATLSSAEQMSWFPPQTSAHLHIDTGMNRNGVRYDSISKILEQLPYTTLNLTGIFTHFLDASDPDMPSVHKQYGRFKDLRSFFPADWITHISNTGASTFYPNLKGDMIRPGIGLYGYAPGNAPIPSLSPISAWKTQVALTKPIKAGETVSYGGTWTANSAGWLHVLPVGYADGLPRGLSHSLSVFSSDGESHPIRGTITMDYSMFVHSKPYAIDTEITLTHPKKGFSEWAAIMNTIPYEILTSISPKRVFRKWD